MSSVRIQKKFKNHKPKPKQFYASENKTSSYEIKADEIVVNKKKEFGSGTRGVVYKGVWAPKNKNEKYDVAVKQYKSGDHKYFEDELKILMLLRSLPSTSPNVIQFHGCIPTSGNNSKAKYDIVMEYAAQGSLQDFFKLGKSLKPAQCYKVVAGALNGLNFLHEHNILYRDFKPGNILLDEKMEPKLSDFDSAVQISSDSEEARGYEGTPSYMAPEIIRTGKSTKKSDVFSAGMTLFQIMSNDQNIYPSEWNDHQIQIAIARKKRAKIPSTWPSELAELIQNCWHQDPALRPTTAEVMERIKKIGGKKKEITTQKRPR